jgi:DNA ligase (NAD+)
MDKKIRIEELVSLLNAASEAYYNGLKEIMSNFQWDAYFDELSALEAETGYMLPNSPTQKVGFEASTGVKEPHEFPALSLAKTKKISDLQKWAGDRPIWLSWKLDGLTLVLTYDGGELTKIVTRGNGTIGTYITYMKSVIKGFPQQISYQKHLVVRGEATISYTDFEQINDTIEDDGEKYANPRNLAAGTLALDVSNIEKVRERSVTFYAFTLVYTEDELLSWGKRMDYLEALGFRVVDRELTDAEGISDVITRWTEKVEAREIDLPVDGLVICFDDTEYSSTGSVTGHHATRAGYAFKWEDVSTETELDHVEWSCAVSTISPVAVFEPVQLEGTTVSRASLCNISEMERLGIGEDHHTTLEVIKANKIIPKCIAVKKKEGIFSIPEECPVCHAKTEIRVSPNSGTKTLHCSNPDCTAKHVKKFNRFVSKTGMDIDGLSIQTLIKFMNLGFIAQFSDIYRLKRHINEIKELEGFGEKSCDNLMASIEKSRTVQPVNFIFALCIPLVGIDAGKKIIRTLGFNGFLTRMQNGESFDDIDGIGPEKSNAILQWYQNPKNHDAFASLLNELTVIETGPSVDSAGKCSGLVFVITGEVAQFQNRDEFKAYVEGQNGSVTSSVSKKTNYLVNNEIESNSSKNKKAKELNIPIITEQQFIDQFGS